MILVKIYKTLLMCALRLTLCESKRWLFYPSGAKIQIHTGLGPFCTKIILVLVKFTSKDLKPFGNSENNHLSKYCCCTSPRDYHCQGSLTFWKGPVCKFPPVVSDLWCWRILVKGSKRGRILWLKFRCWL